MNKNKNKFHHNNFPSNKILLYKHLKNNYN